MRLLALEINTNAAAAACTQTVMAASRSVADCSPEEFSRMAELFKKKNPFLTPERNEWVLAGDKLVWQSGASRPEIVLPPGEYIGWFSTVEPNTKKGLPAKLVIKFETECPVVPGKALPSQWEFLKRTFGPGGTMAKAIGANFQLMGKHKPPSVTKKTFPDDIERDLQSRHGKPLFMPTKFKTRPGREGAGDGAEREEPLDVVKMTNIQLPLSGAIGPPRESGVLPDEIAGVFDADHPVVEFFLKYPNVTVAQNVNLTVADGTLSWPRIVAAATIQGSSQHFVKLFGTVRLGGISARYWTERKLWLLNMYLNRPGGLHMMLKMPRRAGGDADGAVDNSDIYGKRAPAEEARDIYDSEADAAKRARNE